MLRLILLLFLFTLPQHNVMAQSSSYPEQWDSDLTKVLQNNHLEKVGSSIFTFLFWLFIEYDLNEIANPKNIELHWSSASDVLSSACMSIFTIEEAS